MGHADHDAHAITPEMAVFWLQHHYGVDVATYRSSIDAQPDPHLARALLDIALERPTQGSPTAVGLGDRYVAHHVLDQGGALDADAARYLAATIEFDLPSLVAVIGEAMGQQA